MIAATTKLRARYQETDRMGIVYHSNYFIWFEIGRTELFRKIGISYPDLEKNGYFLVVTETNCKYKAPATYDNELEILTQLTELKNSILTFYYEVIGLHKIRFALDCTDSRHKDWRVRQRQIPSQRLVRLGRSFRRKNLCNQTQG